MCIRDRPKAHILGNKWRKVRDEAERLFDKRKEQGYYSLAPELRRRVMRCHRHLGHMPPDQLARVLADAGAKLEVIQWTRRYFECPVCKATIKPGLPRPAAARKTYEFNRTVGADHFTHHFAAQPFDFLNVLCWGTGKMMVANTTSKTALATRVLMVQVWVKPFGFMELLVVDQGPEFAGEEFANYFREQGVLVHFTDGQSPLAERPHRTSRWSVQGLSLIHI